MLDGLTLILRSLDFSLKYIPFRVLGKWFIDKNRLTDITFERIPIEKQKSAEKIKNSHTVAYLNQVIRSSSKISRTTKKHSIKSKITKPTTLEEKTLYDFHTTDLTKLKYVGTYKEKKHNGVIEEFTDDKIEDSLFNLIQRTNTNSENKIIYLQGNIGCGKSTILSTLLVKSTILRASQIREQPRNALKIDICIVSFENLIIPKNLKDSDELLSLIYDKIKSEILRQVDVSGGDVIELIKNAANQRRFTIILDGLDFIYTAFCRLCFDLESNLSIYHQTIYSLISDFCIIAFRNETFEIIKNTSEELSGVHRIDIPEENIYSLHSIPKENLFEVFSRRAKYAANTGKSNLKISASKSTIFDEYYDIAIHGLRHIMDTWQKSFCTISLEKIEARLLYDEIFFKIFFLTSGINHYSQINHGLTNIFLINPNYRADSGDITVTDAIDMDKHNYWLKYFMLVYIVENNTDKSAVISLFTSKSTFSAGLIRIILMGFSDIEHGRVLKPNMGRFNGHTALIVGLEATARAKRSIHSGLFFSFEYLCCVVEDTYLRVPSSVIQHFKNPRSLDFFITEDDDQFKIGKFEYLKEKCISVITFIVILEEAYKIEKKKNPELFKIFENSRYQKYVPDFKKIRNDSIIAIGKLSQDYEKEKISELKKIIVKGLSINEREVIRRSLLSIFK